MIREIQIVKNSDRCHVIVDGVPQATFLFKSYKSSKLTPIEQALNDAKVVLFDLMADMQQFGHDVKVNSKIPTL